jgi:hypothetical protein
MLTAGAYAPTAQAMDAPIVREIYTCNFNEGKDMGDLMAARDFYLKQMEKAGQDPGTAFVWLPYKAPVDFDFLWANNQGSMMDYAETTDEFNASAEGKAAMERFNTVASCTSSLAMRQQIYQADGEMTPGADGAVINALACNYNHGRGPEDLPDIASHIARAVGSVDIADGSAGFVSVPTIGAGPNTRDVYFYRVSDSMTSWAKRNMALQASEEYASLGRHFQNVMDCSSALFTAQRVVPPAE